MKPFEPNKMGLSHAKGPYEEKKIQLLQRADVVWGRMKLEPDEVLLVKVAAHMRPVIEDIKDAIDTIFKREGDRVLLFFEDEMEFTKYTPRER
jgi:hypothetical protein